MKIYNSLTRKKEDFAPIKDGEVSMYVCGPTVYDVPHIGDARSAYIFDVIRRYLMYKNYKVRFVRNVTDVDDKIINKAKEEFPNEDINIAVKKVSKEYLSAYHKALEDLGIPTKAPDVIEPKATEYIEKMKVFIADLIARGVAYIAQDGVYFDVKKAKGYGKLSNQDVTKLEEGARIQSGEHKKDALDFALWKRVKEGEPSWPSDWGAGRPGWHIECSVMSSDILGDQFDIHGGGRDLIFPHHENEIAQSEGADKKFARYWIHHGLLTINAQKMSKSLGNFVTVEEVLKKYPPDILKIFFLQAHYSHPIDFTWEKMEEAASAIERFGILFEKAERIRDANLNSPSLSSTKTFIAKINDFSNKIKESMDDDFNTPQALSYLFEIVTEINKDVHLQPGDMLFASWKIQELGQRIFGIFFKKDEVNPELKFYIEQKIKERNEARKNKDFKKADSIREELKKKGIIIEDTNEGTTWRKRTVYVDVT